MADMNPAALLGRKKGGAQELAGEYIAQDRQGEGNRVRIESGAISAADQAANAKNRKGQAYEDPILAHRARSGAGGFQGGAIEIARGLASGNVPSAATRQYQQGVNTSMAAQQAIGRSGRGSAALATGEAQAGENQAQIAQSSVNQMGALRATDMANGRGMMASALGQAQDQNIAQTGLSNNMSKGRADATDRFEAGIKSAGTALGGVSVEQGNLSRGAYQAGRGVIDAQSDADQEYQTWLAQKEQERQGNFIKDSY